jgi:DNA-binding PadR family transcriptional regulator
MATIMPADTAEGLPRRFLGAFLLLGLERDGTSYGYELYETVKSLGLSVDLAAVYRGLRNMQQRDLVTSQWVSSLSGPDRRLYSLTDSGRRAARDAAAELAAVSEGLVAALEYFGGRADSRANPPHTGEAVARAARERSEQERETPRPDTRGSHPFERPLDTPDSSRT